MLFSKLPAHLTLAWALLAAGVAYAAPKQGELKIVETFAQESLRPGFDKLEFYVLRVEQYRGRKWEEFDGQAGLYFYDPADGNKTAYQLGVTQISTPAPIRGVKVQNYTYIDYLSRGDLLWNEGLKALAIERKGANARAVIKTQQGGVSFRISKKKLTDIELTPFSNVPRASVLMQQGESKRFFLIDKTYLGPQWNNVLIFESSGGKSRPLEVIRCEEGPGDSYEYTVQTSKGLLVLNVPQEPTMGWSGGTVTDVTSQRTQDLRFLHTGPDVLTRLGFDIDRYLYDLPGSDTCQQLIYSALRGL